MSDQQWLRKIGLVVLQSQFGGGGAGDQGPVPSGTDRSGLDLSAMRIKFKVLAMDVDTPPTAVIRVYNLSDDTANRVQKEFQDVILQAGYEGGSFGQIFTGTIKQFRRGKEDATSKFLYIMAADGDAAYNFGVVSKSLAAGASPKQQIEAITQQTAAKGLASGTIPAELGTGGTLPRGKVLFGLARDRLTDIAATTNYSWRIVGGKVEFTKLTGYKSGEAVVLNAATGMISMPEATVGGIHVRALLNPRIIVGGRIQIDNASINQLTVKEQGFPRHTDLTFPAATTEDGFYKVLVVEHFGDTQGQQWYSDITALAIDASAAPDESVKAS